MPKRICTARVLYVRNPLTHTVASFKHTSSGAMRKKTTEYVSLGGLNYIHNSFHRSKGVVEYGDLTHLYHPRFNRSFREILHANPACFRLKSSPITQYIDDCMQQHETNPFRVGR